MFDLSVDLLPLILSYGAQLLGALLLLGAIGAPLPTTLLVVASGAFIRQGMLEPDAVLIGLGCVVAGDSLSFAIGRMGHRRLEQRFHGNRAWQRAIQSFRTSGGAAIYLTRWLFTSIALPTNLVAGSSGYRFHRFLLLDLFGEATWIAVFGGLGYWLGSQWELAADFLPQIGSLGLAVVALIALALWGRNLWRKHLPQRRAKGWAPTVA